MRAKYCVLEVFLCSFGCVAYNRLQPIIDNPNIKKMSHGLAVWDDTRPQTQTICAADCSNKVHVDTSIHLEH